MANVIQAHKRSKFSATITHPHYGTLYLVGIRLRNGRVSGYARRSITPGYNLPPGNHSTYVMMNFSVNCIKEVYERHKD